MLKGYKTDTKKAILTSVWVVVLLGITGSLSLPAIADSSTVLINEVHPTPTSGPEWVEIINNGTTSISLQGWKLYDQVTTPSFLFEFGNVTLQPGEFIVVEVGTKLNNSGDGVELKNEAGSVVSSASYSSAPSGQSWSRYAGSSEFAWVEPSKGAANQALPTASPSPVPSPTSSPTPAPTSSPSPLPIATATPTPQPLPMLVVSEIMACPATGESEWIELYNPSSHTVVAQNWKVHDAAGNTKIISGTLLPFQFTILSWSGSLLNNSGDSAKLVSDAGVVISQAELDGCTSGQSWQWKNGSWQLSDTPTPGLANSSGNVSNSDETVSLSSDLPESSSLQEYVELDETVAGESAKTLNQQRLPFSNEELSKLAPRLAAEAPNTLLPPSSLPSPTPQPTPAWWVFLWIWGGILGGGSLVSISAAYLLWRHHHKHHQSQGKPPQTSGGSSPFKWELG